MMMVVTVMTVDLHLGSSYMLGVGVVKEFIHGESALCRQPFLKLD